MKNSIIGAACGCLSVFFVLTAYAVVINPIPNLDINGTLYNVTFHDASGGSYQALWDADDDGIFGGGTSTFSVQPTFWLDQAGAEAARDAIIAALGANDATTGNKDGFRVPYSISGGGTILPGSDTILFTNDSTTNLANDTPNLGFAGEGATIDTAARPYASFSIMSVSGPTTAAWLLGTPAMVWLFGALLAGIGVRQIRYVNKVEY